MTQDRETGAAEEARAGKPLGENPFVKFVQRPRIMLVMLAGWSFLGFLTELFQGGGAFVESKGGAELELDGALGGLALGWEGIPLAVLYLYCARDPVRYQRVFWLALIHQASLFAANIYQWLGRGAFTFESVLIPLAVSAGLGTLVFLQLFRPREQQEWPGGQAA